MKQQAEYLLRHSRLPEYGKLIILMFAALIATFLLVDNHTTADALFQSPASPVQESPAQQPVEQAPAQQPAEQAPAQPPTETEQQPIQSESPVAPETPQLSTIDEPPPLPQPTPIPRTDNSDDLLDEEEGASNFILDRVEMVDSLVVSGAYVWLCCGAVFLLLIPLTFLLLQIRGQIKLRREQNL